MDSNIKRPKLLIQSFSNEKEIINQIKYGNYFCTDKEVPMLRMRGTILDTMEDGSAKLVGWQRDITSIRKMDISLPFIVYLDINAEGKIVEIKLDESLNGGKGLLCSKDYIEDNIRKTYLNNTMNARLLNKINLKNIQCFHITEILNSCFSQYKIYKKIGGTKLFEQEVTDAYAKDGNLYLTGAHSFGNSLELEYTLVLYNVFSKIVFELDGYMKFVKEVKVDFYLNKKLVLTDYIFQEKDDLIFTLLQRYLIKCVQQVSKMAYPTLDFKILNTNLAPASAVGMVVQSIGVRVFKDNYNYLQHVITALQRPMKAPGCIGSALNNEVNTIFPGLIKFLR